MWAQMRELVCTKIVLPQVSDRGVRILKEMNCINIHNVYLFFVYRS